MSKVAKVVGKAEAPQPLGRTLLKGAAVCGVVVLIGVLAWWLWPAAPQFNWQRYLRTDADYAIELPGTPEITLEPAQTEFGPTTMQTTQFVMQKPPVLFAVHYSPFPVNSPFQKMTRPQAEASMQQFVSLLPAKMDGKLLGQSEVGLKGGIAREFRIEVPGKQVYYGRMFYSPTAQYQMAVLAPQEAETPAYVTKFFKSFEYLGNP